MSIAHAELALLRAALGDARNERFVLLSESCAPLHALRCTYAFAFASVRSFVATWPTAERRARFNFGARAAHAANASALPTDVQHWRKGRQWVLLTRAHAAVAYVMSLEKLRCFFSSA